MLWQSTSDGMAAQVAMIGRVHRMGNLKALLADAAKWKPAGYNSDVAKRRDYYNGHQLPHTRNALQRRYPNTYEKMYPYTAPVFRHLVEQMASMYRAAPRREWLGVGADTWAGIYADASVDAKLWRAEQVSAAARLAFIRVYMDDIDERIEIDTFWPDMVEVICDPDRPTKLDAASALIARIASSDGLETGPGTVQRFEVWLRVSDGWTRQVVTSSGDETAAEYYPRLPWVAIPFDGFTGDLFPSPPSDEIAVNEAIDSLYTHLLYTVQMQSHTQLWYAGPRPEHKLVGGPGTIWDAGESGQFGSIGYTPQIDAVNRVADDIVTRLLTLRGVSPVGATADPAYMAAVAVKVLNQPMHERRESRVHVWRDIEERRLWPIIGELIGADMGDSLRWYPGELQMSLDDQVEFRLAQGRVQTGASTWPKEMVRLGIAADIDDAQRQYEENLEYNKNNEQNYLVPFIKGASIAPAPEEPTSGSDGQV